MASSSLHPVKSITTGEGGLVTTHDPSLYRELIRFRSHGINKGSDHFLISEQAETSDRVNPWYYEMQDLGFNYRLTDIQAALGISQLAKLDQFMEHRKTIALLYDKYLEGNPLVRPAQQFCEGSAHHLYPVRIDFAGAGVSRAYVMDELRQLGIGTQVHYIPIPMHPYYRSLGFTMDALPNAARYYSQALSLPIHMGVSQDHVRRVVDALNSILLLSR